MRARKQHHATHFKNYLFKQNIVLHAKILTKEKQCLSRPWHRCECNALVTMTNHKKDNKKKKRNRLSQFLVYGSTVRKPGFLPTGFLVNAFSREGVLKVGEARLNKKHGLKKEVYKKLFRQTYWATGMEKSSDDSAGGCLEKALFRVLQLLWTASGISRCQKRWLAFNMKNTHTSTLQENKDAYRSSKPPCK